VDNGDGHAGRGSVRDALEAAGKLVEKVLVLQELLVVGAVAGKHRGTVRRHFEPCRGLGATRRMSSNTGSTRLRVGGR
jgi:hypothetical protein